MSQAPMELLTTYPEISIRPRQYALEIFKEADKVKRKAMLEEVPVWYQGIVKAHVDAWWRHR